MEQFIGCDAHKKFSVFVAVDEKGRAGEALRVVHGDDARDRESGSLSNGSASRQLRRSGAASAIQRHFAAEEQRRKGLEATK